VAVPQVSLDLGHSHIGICPFWPAYVAASHPIQGYRRPSVCCSQRGPGRWSRTMCPETVCRSSSWTCCASTDDQQTNAGPSATCEDALDSCDRKCPWEQRSRPLGRASGGEISPLHLESPIGEEISPRTRLAGPPRARLRWGV